MRKSESLPVLHDYSKVSWHDQKLVIRYSGLIWKKVMIIFALDTYAEA